MATKVSFEKSIEAAELKQPSETRIGLAWFVLPAAIIGLGLFISQVTGQGRVDQLFAMLFAVSMVACVSYYANGTHEKQLAVLREALQDSLPALEDEIGRLADRIQVLENGA